MKNKLIIIGIIAAILAGITLIIVLVSGNKTSNKNNETETKKEEVKSSYNVEFEDEYVDVKDSTGKVIFQNKKVIAKVTGDNADDAKKIADTINGKVSDMFYNAEEMDLSFCDEADCSGFGVSIVGLVELQGDNFVSISLSMDGGFGGVSWNDFVPMIISTKGDIKALELKDICDGTEINDVLLKTAKKYITENNLEDDIIVEDYETRLKELIKSNIGFDSYGLYFVISKYEIFNGAAGYHDIGISYREASKYLKEEYILNN